MDVSLVAIVFGALGLAVGLAAVLAFQFSKPRDASDDVGPAVPDGISEVLAVLPSAAIVVDAGNDVVKASPAAYAFGLVAGHSMTKPRLKEAAQAVQASGLIDEFDVDVPRHAGNRYRSLHVRVAPLGSYYVLILCDDFTEARRVEETRRDFVANVSHELKTPVGAISLLSEAIAGSPDDADAVRHFSGKIEQESSRLSALVQEIIDLSRLQDTAGTDDERVDARDVMSEAAARCRFAADGKDVRLRIEPGDAYCVRGSRELLITAVKNLIDNAVAYSPEHTVVDLWMTGDGDTVRLSVTDQGIGLADEDTERIFERFYRVDAARSRSTGGTGLGLSIVKHVAKSHGGAVRVKSAPGAGSTFTLELPLDAGEGPASGENPASGEDPASGTRAEHPASGTHAEHPAARTTRSPSKGWHRP